MDDTFACTRCGRSDVEPLGIRPFPNELGERLAAEVCHGCWEAWKKQQMLLINHYGLNLQDANARKFLLGNLKAFLFQEGAGGSSIDESQQGKVSW